MATIFPSLITGNIMNIEKQINQLENHCDGYHIDVMDDHFVPSLTWGSTFVNGIAQQTSHPLFVHLMVDNPEIWPSRLQINTSSIICFHIETAIDPKNLIKQITEKNNRVGIALKPKTPLEKIYSVTNLVDYVLLLSVEPGFSGQTFLSSALERLNELFEHRKHHHESFAISMDGGIGLQNIKILFDLGVENFGIGSAIFAQQDPIESLDQLYHELS